MLGAGTNTCHQCAACHCAGRTADPPDDSAYSRKSTAGTFGSCTNCVVVVAGSRMAYGREIAEEWQAFDELGLRSVSRECLTHVDDWAGWTGEVDGDV
jgi:hypothetical protein